MLKSIIAVDKAIKTMQSEYFDMDFKLYENQKIIGSIALVQAYFLLQPMGNTDHQPMEHILHIS